MYIYVGTEVCNLQLLYSYYMYIYIFIFIFLFIKNAEITPKFHLHEVTYLKVEHFATNIHMCRAKVAVDYIPMYLHICT
jgi:hypothetical protein